MAEKPAGYYASDRSAFLGWVGGNPTSVLDIGCGAGSSGEWFRSRGASQLVGVEIDAKSAAAARRVYDSVLSEPIESAIPKLAGPFDLILCADVLEHLIDPWTVVRDLHRLAGPNTTVAVSIPNIRYGPALWQIAFGRGFEYASEGIFDRTHLRFFTRWGIETMLTGAGWDIERWGRGLRSRAARVASRLTGGRCDEWLAYQWFVAARPR